MSSFVSALLLSAASTVLPYPAPYVGPVSAEARFASGQLAQVDPAGKGIIVNTGIGPLKVIVDPTSKVYGTDGKPLPAVTSVRPGYYVRVFFSVKNGAHLEELDVLPAAMR